MQQLPWIGAGHLAYVFTWALLGMCVSAVAWANARAPTYKDYLAGTLGISFEALGVEIAGGEPALIVPLALSLLFALLIRYMPSGRFVRVRRGRRRLKQMKSVLLVVTFFWIQVVVLLLAYRGWWDALVLYPEV